MRRAALVVSGLIFAVIAVMQFIRYNKAWAVQVADYTLPVEGSLYAAIVFALLALWTFLAASKNR